MRFYYLSNRIFDFPKIIFFCFFLSSCGKIYFPLGIENISREARSNNQEITNVEIIPMTYQSIRNSNADPYSKILLKTKNLDGPATDVSARDFLTEKFPVNSNPGPYLLDVGDILTMTFLPPLDTARNISGQAFDLAVDNDGLVNVLQIGRFQARGKSVFELEDLIYPKFYLRKILTSLVG